MFPRRIAILGGTGSIGRGALEVIAFSRGELCATVVTAHQQTQILADELRKLAACGAALPECLIITDATANLAPLEEFRARCTIRCGSNALEKVLRTNEFGCDIVLSAIVGIAGLASTRAALEAGITVALANKECLVVGGELLTSLAEKNGVALIPVDSEHSGVLQCLSSLRDAQNKNENANKNSLDEVAKIILTASGGPFRTRTLRELENVTVADALAHPTWQMGRKVTIDSATLMNKALELIEARWLFGIDAARLAAVIHPQSMIHALVEFIDGSTLVQMSPPDMRMPIQLALNYPQRKLSPATKIDWSTPLSLELLPLDEERFPAVRLGREVAAAGGTAGVVFNAANEVAVEMFLTEKIPFSQIVIATEKVLQAHHHETHPTWERLSELDLWARREMVNRKW